MLKIVLVIIISTIIGTVLGIELFKMFGNALLIALSGITFMLISFTLSVYYWVEE